MDEEVNDFLHIRTTVIISYRFVAEKTIGVYNLLIIKSKKHSSQNVHLFHNHLYNIQKTED